MITGETSDDVAREMGEHIASAHPTMKVPDQAEMRRLVGKARMYGETAQATILLHKKDEE